jgi:hypothetical protein
MGATLEINGNEIPYLKEISDLENLLVFADRLDGKNDEIIVETRLDGHIFSEEYPRQSKDVKLENFKKVEIQTQRKEDFAKDFMKKAPVFIDQINSGITRSCELLREKENQSEGYKILALSLGAFRSFKNHIENVTSVIGIENNKRTDMEKCIFEKLERVTDKILKAQENNSEGEISNILETDLLETMNDWKRVLSDYDKVS